jgi:hypothetical protein
MTIDRDGFTPAFCGLPALPMPAKRKSSHRFKRFRQWLKQVILLGRTDWRRASDDAHPPRLSQSERDELRPHFDVAAIRPRSVTAADRPQETDQLPPREVYQSDAARPGNSAPEDPPRSSKSREFRRQRSERPRQIAVNPLSAFTPDKMPASKLERLFEKYFGRRE